MLIASAIGMLKSQLPFTVHASSKHRGVVARLCRRAGSSRGRGELGNRGRQNLEGSARRRKGGPIKDGRE
eukprot:15214246-Alexandrium_andersonii.AAC.1